MNLTQSKRLIAIGLLGFSGCHENLPAPAAVRQPTKALEKVKIDGLVYVVTAIVAVAVVRMKCPDCGGEMTCAGPVNEFWSVVRLYTTTHATVAGEPTHCRRAIL